MAKFKVGDKVKWNPSQKGVWIEGVIIDIERFPARDGYKAFTRHKVRVTKDVTWFSKRFNQRTGIKAGEIGYPVGLKRVR